MKDPWCIDVATPSKYKSRKKEMKQRLGLNSTNFLEMSVGREFLLFLTSECKETVIPEAGGLPKDTSAIFQIINDMQPNLKSDIWW